MGALKIEHSVAHCKKAAQPVLSQRAALVAFICRRCLVVLCRDCHGRVFFADGAREARMCRCRSYTAGAR